jgi:hypothetical protein
MWIVAGVVVGLACGGCGRAIGEGLGEVRGAASTALVIGSTQEPPGVYTQLTVRPMTSEAGDLVPVEFDAMVAAEIQKQAAAGKVLPKIAGAARRQVIVEGRYVHYQANDSKLSPHAEAVARVRLIDGPTGEVLVTANCVGRGNVLTNVGTKDIANALADAIVKLIRQTVNGKEDSK